MSEYFDAGAAVVAVSATFIGFLSSAEPEDRLVNFIECAGFDVFDIATHVSYAVVVGLYVGEVDFDWVRVG